MQHHNQQVLAKPCHNPSDRDQQAREKLQQKAKIKSQAYTQLGEETLQTVHRTFQPDIPVIILHLPALADGSLHSKSTSTPTLFVIQEGLNCLETTGYFLTNIEPAPIIVKCPAVHQNKPPPQQAASSKRRSNFTTNTPPTTRQNQDLSIYAHQQASTSTKSYRNQHYLTRRSPGHISFSLCLLPWWKKRYRRPKYRVNNYLIVILQMKRQIHDFIHQKRKEFTG